MARGKQQSVTTLSEYLLDLGYRDEALGFGLVHACLMRPSEEWTVDGSSLCCFHSLCKSGIQINEEVVLNNRALGYYFARVYGMFS